MKKTRECTQVFFQAPEEDFKLRFSQQSYKVMETFSSKPFKSSVRISNEDLDAMLREANSTDHPEGKLIY